MVRDLAGRHSCNPLTAAVTCDLQAAKAATGHRTAWLMQATPRRGNRARRMPRGAVARAPRAGFSSAPGDGLGPNRTLTRAALKECLLMDDNFVRGLPPWFTA